jgi:endonuclease YncB( thermonuclease family)
MRLHGIATTAPDQTCNAGGPRGFCGKEATFVLVFETSHNWLRNRRGKPFTPRGGDVEI